MASGSPVKGEGGQGITSDYGSASDVVTQQLSGSRTEGLRYWGYDFKAEEYFRMKESHKNWKLNTR